MEKYYSAIGASILFKGIPESDVPALTANLDGKIKKYSKGEMILMMDAEVLYLGIILSGSVHMIKENHDGHKTLFAILKKGEAFGESFTCGNENPFYLSLQAAADTIVYYMPCINMVPEKLNSRVYHRIMMHNLIASVSGKNIKLMEKIDICSQKTVQEKLTTYFSILKKHQGSDRLTLDMNRTLLAEYLEVNRSAMTRTLKIMRDQGYLDYEKNTVVLNRDY